MLFSIHTIHDVHDWLQTHDIFDIPNCPSLDRITNESILEDTLEHLSALLNFIGVRAGEQLPPGARSKGEPAEGGNPRQRKRRGPKRRYDPKNDQEIEGAWERAKGQHVMKKDFVVDWNKVHPKRDISVKSLDKLLGRRRKARK